MDEHIRLKQRADYIGESRLQTSRPPAWRSRKINAAIDRKMRNRILVVFGQSERELLRKSSR